MSENLPLYQTWLRIREVLPSGVDVLSADGDTRPLIIKIPRIGIVHAYVWVLGESGVRRAAGEHKIQMKLPGQRDGERRQIDAGNVLILGYSFTHDVIVSWEARHHLSFSYNTNVQFPQEALERAHRDGFAIADTRKLRGGPETRIACARHQFLDLVVATCEADRRRLGERDRIEWIQAALKNNRGAVLHESEGGKSGPKTVHIRPKVGLYGAFGRLNYYPWYALAEFVDNALQSHLLFTAGHRSRAPLRVEIDIDDERITVRDNAYGIGLDDFSRAFSPAERPPKDDGLSEFGIGMKAAACWFADHWSVVSKAARERIARTVEFDVPKIIGENIEDLRFSESPAGPAEHYTIIKLERLRVHPKGRTIGKIKSHLASMYRQFLRAGQVEIVVRTQSREEVLAYVEPEILVAPRYDDLRGKTHEWKKPIDIVLGEGRRIHGWVGLLARADTTRAGLSIFRRNRLIQGSDDMPYRPRNLFGGGNKFRAQRVVAELHVEGFGVSHTKDGIQWDDIEDDIIDKLREKMNAEPLPILRQAENYRVRKSIASLPGDFGIEAVRGTAEDIGQKIAEVVDSQLDRPSDGSEPTELLGEKSERTVSAVSDLWLHERGQRWHITFELVRIPAAPFYATTHTRDDTQPGVGNLAIRVNLQHPFSERFIIEDEASLHPVLRLVSSLAIAEITARESGVRNAGAIRHRVNEILAATAED